MNVTAPRDHSTHALMRAATRLFSAVLAVLLLISATPALAITRSSVMARAQTWVDATLPYSQTGWADEAATVVASATLGWRRDCSGFVSMAWNTPKSGYSTRTLHTTATRITKTELLPGDALVSYNNHAVLFGGWANTEQTEYWAYEMSSSQSSRTGDGTVVRKTPYPYWPGNSPETYVPYRLNGITADADYTAWLDIVAGADRYATALAASRVAFTDGSAPAVVIASGADWPDALAASALAGATGGPVLLTPPNALADSVAAEIARLGAREAIIVGGEGALSSDVAAALAGLPNVTVSRIAGANRYETSQRVATETARRLGARFTSRMIVATGEGFADALAAAPLAARAGWPVVLTPGSELGTPAAEALASTGARSALIVGGDGVVAPAVAASIEASLGADAVQRIAGADRYDTALAVAAYGTTELGLTYTGLAIANGEGFADALAGGAMAARLNTVLLLTRGTSLPSGVASALTANASVVGKPRVLGGEAVVSPQVREMIVLALAQ